jgi:hypothetical protein
MKKLIIAVAAAGAMVTTLPAVAQVAIEGPGVELRVGPDPDRRYYRHYGSDTEFRYRNRDRGCRTVTVRERRPNGDVVVRKRTRC